MPTWWSPLGDTVQRLLGRGAGPDGAPPEGSAAPVPAPPARPSPAWPWQPPVQRALDPGWQPALRPDDFAAGLSSHQDPSLRRDLVHDVRPGAGGVVDGLADLAPGLPVARAATVPLTVRPLPSAPPVQRRLAAFLPTPESDPSEPATVALEPPWAAEPEARGDAVEPSAGAPVDDAVGTAGPVEADPVPTAPAAPPTTSETPVAATAPVGTRDVRVQRHASAAPGAPASDVSAPVLDAVRVPGPVEPGDAERVVAPTVSRSASGPAPEGQRTADVTVRTLPVTATPVPPRPVASVPTTPRALPVLQRQEVTPPPADAPGPGRSVDQTGDPGAGSASAAPDVVVPTAPLSGFADAIQRLAVPAGADDLPEPVESAEPAGPVVPGPSAATSREWDAAPSTTASWSEPSAAGATGSAADVGTEPQAVPTPGDPVAGVDPERAPLLGSEPDPGAAAASAVASVVPVAPVVVGPVQRTELADLPVVALAHEPEPRPERDGTGDVPRLWPVGAAPAPARAPSPGTADVPDRPVVVARTPVTAASSTIASPGRPGEPSASGPTVALTGAHPLRVQRSEPGRVSPSIPAPPAVQPLRFGEVDPRPTGASGAWQHVGPRPTPPAVQRALDALPAVAPGLVAPTPVEGAPAAVQALAGTEEPALERSAPTGPAATGVVGLLRAQPTARLSTSRARPVQRLAGLPTPRPGSGPSAASAGLVRALPFDQMFAAPGPDGPQAGDTEAGWTTVELPVVSAPDPPVQRAVDTDAMTVEPAPAAPPPAPEPAPAPAPAAPPPPATPGPGGGADLDEMARRLFDPLSARLRAELWLDRERAGLVADARF